MKPCNFYPIFESNQVLTAEQLNQISSYFDRHDRLTRSKLIGVGIVCGLEVTFDRTPKPTITISKGVGISTEGYLIVSEKSVLTQYRLYQDPGKYEFFGDSTTQIQLWELLPDNIQDEDGKVKKLNIPFLKNKAVLLYLEIKEVDLETCIGDDCDEKGKRIELCPKKLLIDIEDLKIIINKCVGAKPISTLDQKINAKFKLPEISIGREASLISKYKLVDYSGIQKLYRDIINPSLRDIQRALIESYDRFEPVLSGEYDVNPFGETAFLKKIKQHLELSPQGIQYLYDFLKDTILAYNEFKESAFELASACCYNEKCFPRHLMLGEAIPMDSCPPSTLRHRFIQAPIYNGQNELLKRMLMLFKRLVHIVKSFALPAFQQANIKVTPSKEKGTDLSKRSIPYYYRLKTRELAVGRETYIHHIWNYDLKRKCRPYLNLSYHSDKYPEKETPDFISNPLVHDTDNFSFYRIEGHLRHKCDETTKKLLSVIKIYNLPFKVIKLKFGKIPDKKDLKLDCRMKDLELMYSAMRAEYQCLLEKGIKYFSELDYSKPITSEEKTGGLKGTVLTPDNELLPGISVSLTSMTAKAATYGAITDATGKFFFRNITPDQYRLSATLAGFKAYSVIIKIEPSVTKTIEIQLQKGGVETFDTESAGYILERYPILEGFVRTMEPEKHIKMISEEPYIKGDFLKNIPSFSFTEKSVGNVYLDYTKSDERNIFSFIDKSKDKYADLFGKLDIREIVEKYYHPMQIIDAIEDLLAVIPVKITNFDMSSVIQRDNILISIATAFRDSIYASLKDPKYKPTGRESEILINLEELIHKCILRKFEALIKIYKERLVEIQKLTLFHYFIQDHSGMEHKAGVPVGGTFILLCDENDIVVADFSLPYICCSDCPPITFVAAATPVIFKLPKNSFCSDDNTNYAVIAEPSGGEVKGPGVSKDNATGQYVFNPSKAGTGLTKLTYLVNLNTCELFVNVIEIKPTFIYELVKPVEEEKKREVKFTPIPQGADSYIWNFGDDSEESYEEKPTHKYDISDKQAFEVKLTLKKDGCTGTGSQKIEIPYCTAEFNHNIERIVNDVAIVTFKSDMQDAEKYAWDFGDGSKSIDRNPMHEYKVSEVTQYNVTLKVTKGDCEDDSSEEIKITACTAIFSDRIIDIVGNTAEFLFTAKTLDANIYRWDFGDNSSYANKPELKHTYILKKEEQKITVTLSIRKEICTAMYSKEVILPPMKEISFELEKEIFCKKDKKEYLFKINVEGGRVVGRGVVVKDDKYYFVPAREDVLPDVVKFVYSIPGGPSAVLTVRVLNPVAKFEVEGISQPDPEIAASKYLVKFRNQSSGAANFVWRINETIFSKERNPRLEIPDAKPRQQFEISLAAIIGDCGDVYPVTITIPDSVVLIPDTNVTVLTHGDSTVVVNRPTPGTVSVSDAVLGAYNANLRRLNNLNDHPNFDSALTANVIAYRDTNRYLNTVKEELSNSTIKRRYILGIKNNDMAREFGSLFDSTYNRIKKYEGVGAKRQRQFTYNLVMIQLSQLLNLIGLQKSDIKAGSDLAKTFGGVAVKMKGLKELQVNIDPEGKLSGMIKSTAEVAANKPVLLTMLDKLSAVLNE